MKRLLKWKRLRWFAVGTLVRFFIRRSASRSVDRATADLEERLPGPLRKAMDIVPADAVRAGGSAVVAGRTARRVASGTRSASRLAGDRGRRVAEGMHRIRSIGDEIGREAEHKRRELKADYLRVTRGNGAADDALLDLRGDEESPRHRSSVEDGNHRHDPFHEEDLPEVQDPIRRGRWRAERRLGSTMVNRVQRSYRQPSRPWDR